MALVTLEGVYDGGTIRLSEQPDGVRRARVVVTFLPEGEEIPERDEIRRAEAVERMLATMRAGIDFGGGRFDREEIYEERMSELDARSR